MRKRRTNIINFILVASIAAGITGIAVEQSMLVKAATISDIETQISQHENQLEGISETINVLTDEQDLIQEMIDDLNAEIINMMTSIGMKEDELAAKEEELVNMQVELANKQVEIDETQIAYEEAKAREEKQYADMQVWIKCMYENSSSTYLGHFLKGDGLGDMLNHMDYIEKVYAYGMEKLAEYEATKDEVHALWEQLEAEKVQLETEKARIESDKSQLEADKDSLQTQKQNLDAMLAKKKQESANYDAEINRYKQEAAVARRLLQQEQQQLEQLQEQQRLEQLQAQQNQQNQNQQNQSQQNQNQQNQQGSNNSPGNTTAATGTYTPTDYTSTIDNASGSDLGKRVAKYACQYIGNPYVYGGTSLTNGADCSGFTFRVYKDFDYNLPRTSYEQRSAGKGVNYSDAQPGDLICYDGHVGIYIGGGKIVHASSSRTGIKVSNANYRTILAVRRII